MKRILIVGALALGLVGCEAPVSIETTQTEFYITDVKKPKRMYVTLVEKATGRHYREYVSKRCSRWEEVKVGSSVTLTMTKRTWDDGSQTVDIDAYPVCPR